MDFLAIADHRIGRNKKPNKKPEGNKRRRRKLKAATALIPRQTTTMRKGLVLFSLAFLFQESSVQALKAVPHGSKNAISNNKNAFDDHQVIATSERQVENRNPLSIEAHVLTVFRQGAIESFQSKMVPEDPNPNNKHNPLWVEEYVYTGERRGPEMTETTTERRRKHASLLASASSTKKR
jgi:hypothetical protein